MLIIVKNIDENIIDSLLDIYSESMEAMESKKENGFLRRLKRNLVNDIKDMVKCYYFYCNK